ncbi:MAG TPA: hypothetical protein VN578_20325 [Candidatus Binatia bacterium]|nr:hypothetical protein [Candidatus Binatia bacterium]
MKVLGLDSQCELEHSIRLESPQFFVLLPQIKVAFGHRRNLPMYTRHHLSDFPSARKQPARPFRPPALTVRNSVLAHHGPRLALWPAIGPGITRTAVGPAVRARHLAARALPALSRMSTVRNPSRLLRNGATHVVHVVCVRITRNDPGT